MAENIFRLKRIAKSDPFVTPATPLEKQIANNIGGDSAASQPLPEGARPSDLQWIEGARYNVDTGEYEELEGRATLHMFTLENAHYKIHDDVKGRLPYLDLIEWDENGQMVTSMETVGNTPFITFCANPRHYYTININDVSKHSENLKIDRLPDSGSAKVEIELNESTAFVKGNMIYVIVTDAVKTAIPGATTDAKIAELIDRANTGLKTYAGGNGSAGTKVGNGEPYYVLAYWGGSTLQLCISNLNSVEEAVAYYAEHPFTLVLNGADETYFAPNVADAINRKFGEDVVGDDLTTSEAKIYSNFIGYIDKKLST